MAARWMRLVEEGAVAVDANAAPEYPVRVGQGRLESRFTDFPCSRIFINPFAAVVALR